MAAVGSSADQGRARPLAADDVMYKIRRPMPADFLDFQALTRPSSLSTILLP
jgi:hypothetical protein